jgi:hypothetical protein
MYGWTERKGERGKGWRNLKAVGRNALRAHGSDEGRGIQVR